MCRYASGRRLANPPCHCYLLPLPRVVHHRTGAVAHLPGAGNGEGVVPFNGKRRARSCCLLQADSEDTSAQEAADEARVALNELHQSRQLPLDGVGLQRAVRGVCAAYAQA